MSEPEVARSGEDEEPDYTVDAFHRGRFHLVQPKKIGHRSGMDAMVLAATIPDDATGKLADLGAGAGAAGLAVAARVPGVAITLIERSEIMLDFAHRTLQLESNSAYCGRIEILGIDVTLTGNERRLAGLADLAYEWVIFNPPYNDADGRRPPDDLRAEARTMIDPLMFENWLRTASAILKPNAQVSLIARPGSLGLILDAFKGRFGGVEITPIHSRKDDEALRILVTAIKQSRAGLSICPPLIIHDSPGRGFSTLMEALNNGQASLPRRPSKSRKSK